MQMFCIICIGKALIRAIFWHLKFLYWFIRFDVIPNANLATYSGGVEWRHSATDSGYSAMADEGLGAILIPASLRWYFLFFFVSRSYLSSGLISWCNLFLIAYFLNMQQSWAVQSKVQSENKATAAQK